MLGSEQNPNYDWKEVSVYEDERQLHVLLKKYGFVSSGRELRRNRPDLVKKLDAPDFLEIKIGKKRVWIVVEK